MVFILFILNNTTLREQLYMEYEGLNLANGKNWKLGVLGGEPLLILE